MTRQLFKPTRTTTWKNDWREHTDRDRDARIYSNRNVPWRTTCDRMVGSSLQRIHLWLGKLVVESASIEQNEKMGITHGEKIISVQKQRKRNVFWVLHENGKIGKHHLGRNKDSHSRRKSLLKVCGEHWAGYVQDQQTR